MNINNNLRDKLCLIYSGEEDKDEFVFAGGKWSDGYIRSRVRDLGLYSIGIDTISPEIRIVNIKDGETLGENSSIIIHVSDDFSGIGKYIGSIDGNWGIFEWDPKNEILKYTPDPEKTRKDEMHTLSLNVIDNRDNASNLEMRFRW